MAEWPDAAPRPARAEDHAAILRLNQTHEIETSPLDAVSLAALLGQAFAAYVVDGGAAGFVIALDETADYASPNFRWFVERMARFVYIDRVVVAPASRGQGVASRLYRAVMAQAGQGSLVCEVNELPPNPVSDRFHESRGFRCVGKATLSSGKAVRYLRLELP